MNVSLLVPVTESGSHLAELVSEVSAALSDGGYAHDVLVIVGSASAGASVIREENLPGAERLRTVVVGTRDPEAVLPEVVRSETRADILVTLPSYPRIAPAGIRELVDRLDGSVDLVSAARSAEGAPLGSRVRRRAFHSILRLLVGQSFRDVACGVRAMRREVMTETRLFGDAFRFIPVFALRDGFRVREVELPAHRLHTATTMHGPGVYARRLVDLIGLMFLTRFTYKPLRFFGLVGGGLCGMGAVVLLLLFVQRLGGQGVADRPALLLGVLLLTAGVQALALGLVGEIVVHHGLTNHPTYRVLDPPEDD